MHGRAGGRGASQAVQKKGDFPTIFKYFNTDIVGYSKNLPAELFLHSA